MTDLIRVCGLTKRYGTKTVLDNVSLSVPKGGITGFVGANGAGKTTTIRAILGLMPLDAGTVELFGEPFGINSSQSVNARIKSRIGVVLDTCPYIGDLPVKTTSSIMKAAFKSWRQGRFEDYLDRFGLDPHKKVKDLSRGMGMKLQLACALAHEPDLLILDEATAGLDPLARDEVLDILREFVADDMHGILISSHITSDLDKIADTVACIDGGRIVFDLPKDVITDEMGLAKCRTSQFEKIAASGAYQPNTMKFIRYEYGIDLLVYDRFAFRRSFPDVACERLTIDDYMQLTLKGETR